MPNYIKVTCEGKASLTAFNGFPCGPGGSTGLLVSTGLEYLIYAIALALSAMIPGVRLLR